MNFHQKPIAHIGQVDLKVQDLERSIAFYTHIIGFSVLDQTEKSAKLTADGKTALLSLRQPDGVVPKQGRTTGLYHFALLLPTREHLANIVRHFVKIGLPFGSSDHLVSEALYLSDPDGNGIEIYRDRDPSEWTWEQGEVKMTVDPLDFDDLLSAGERSSSWERLPAQTVMGHIHLHVSHLEEAERFYKDGLGFDVANRFGGQALFMSDGKYHHHIGLNTWNGVGAPEPSPQSAGLETFSMIFPNDEKRKKTIARLKNMGFLIEREGDDWIARDPSGNRVRLEV